MQAVMKAEDLIKALKQLPPDTKMWNTEVVLSLQFAKDGCLQTTPVDSNSNPYSLIDLRSPVNIKAIVERIISDTKLAKIRTLEDKINLIDNEIANLDKFVKYEIEKRSKLQIELNKLKDVVLK